MNPFNKNPFANKNTNTRIISNNINFNETQKIENIRENMNKIKFQNNQIKPEIKQEMKQPNLQEKIDFLRNLDK
jgi:hypothetical protein